MTQVTYGSVCSGIETASLAWSPLGMRPTWFSEIEPFPCAVLRHHWPTVPNTGDMAHSPGYVRTGMIAAPDILVGGTPCQAFSVAGKRGSLTDSRGGLSLIYGDLLNAIDEQREGREAVCLWENVPGVLSTADNAFGWFLGLLAGEYALADCLGGAAKALEAQPGADRQKWPKCGCVVGPRRAVAWRTLDAQYFGVAQRRKRVFVVASARDGFDPAQVLFEREGMRRDTPPGREAGEAAPSPAAAGTGSSHRDDRTQPHPTLNQSHNTGGIGASNQEVFSQRGSGLVPYDMTAFGQYGTGRRASTLKACGHKEATDLVVSATATAIRRLTPLECERLQGIPENHTLLPYGAKQRLDGDLRGYYERHLGRAVTDEEQRGMASDGPRYKAVGNAKAVPVVRWIGERILRELHNAMIGEQA